jgi:hypothetical protein
MKIISANDLKTKGIQMVGNEETIVSYRGKPKYLILPEEFIEEYELFRLERAIRETEEDIKSGRCSTNLEEHFREIDSV